MRSFTEQNASITWTTREARFRRPSNHCSCLRTPFIGSCSSPGQATEQDSHTHTLTRGREGTELRGQIGRGRGTVRPQYVWQRVPPSYPASVVKTSRWGGVLFSPLSCFYYHPLLPLYHSALFCLSYFSSTAKESLLELPPYCCSYVNVMFILKASVLNRFSVPWVRFVVFCNIQKSVWILLGPVHSYCKTKTLCTIKVKQPERSVQHKKRTKNKTKR